MKVPRAGCGRRRFLLQEPGVVRHTAEEHEHEQEPEHKQEQAEAQEPEP